MNRKEFPSLSDWMEEKCAYLVYIISATIFVSYHLTSISLIFSPFSLIFAIIMPIFLIFLVPLLSTYALMTPFYLIAKNRFQKKEELRQIFGRLRLHPEQSIE